MGFAVGAVVGSGGFVSVRGVGGVGSVSGAFMGDTLSFFGGAAIGDGSVGSLLDVGSVGGGR